MAKEVKQKIVLAGEKEYSSAVKEANRNLKTLRSELKAETAELGKNATEQQKAETRTKNLKKQIAEQEKVVQTYKKALEEVREKYGDNEDAIASWEQKLNNARATLGDMRNDLEDVSSSMSQLEVDAGAAVTATKSVADALGQIGSMSDTVAGAIETIFTSMLDTVTEAATEVWALISETAAKANGWTDIAGYWNTDAQTIQNWARAVASSQNSFDDLQNSVSKLVLGDHEKIQKLTNVSFVGDVDEWDYAMKVLDSISGMEYQQKLETLGELFGEKRASRVMDIVNDWSTIQEELNALNGNETGYGMDDRQLAIMNDLWVEIGKVEQRFQALKERVAAGLGESAMKLIVNVEGALDGFAEFLNADGEGEREQALQKIRENVEEFFTKLGEIIKEGVKILNEVGQELQGSDDPVTRMIGDILAQLTEKLQWMIDNQTKVKAAFEAVFGFWLLLKIGAIAGKLSQVIMMMETIQAFKGLGAAAAAGGAKAAAGEAAAGAGGGAGVGAAVGNFLTSTGAKVIGGAGAFFATLFKNAVTPQGNDDLDQWYETQEDYDAAAAEVLKKNREYVEAHKDIEEDELLDDDTRMELSQNIINAAEAYWDEFRRSPFGTGANVDEAYTTLQNLFRPDQDEEFNRLMGLIEDLWTKKEDYPDLPSWWFSDPDNGGAEGLSSEDISGFKGLPGLIQQAAKAGTAAGVSGIKVYMDGVAVGHLVAGTVSRDIGIAIMG